jgi:hypothetical protein
VPIADGRYPGLPVEVSATVADETGVTAAALHYRVAGAGGFSSVPLTPQGGDAYLATIPAGAVTLAGVDYYLAAADAAGGVTTEPGSAPSAFHHFAVVAPPALQAGDLIVSEFMASPFAGDPLGEWFEAASVVFLFALAQWLEARSLDRARRAIRSLMDIAPGEVTVRRHGADEAMAVDEVAVGDTVVIRPGEKIALDGEVSVGESDVNQALVTGESVPVAKGPGDRLYAGSINGHGVIEARVTHLGRDSTLSSCAPHAIATFDESERNGVAKPTNDEEEEDAEEREETDGAYTEAREDEEKAEEDETATEEAEEAEEAGGFGGLTWIVIG